MIDMEKFPVLKSLNRFIITFFFVLGVTFNMVAPFCIVHADSNYYLLDDTRITIPISFNYSSSVTVKKNSGDSSVYVYLTGQLTTTNRLNYARFVFVSDSSANVTLNRYYQNYTFDLTYNSAYDKYTYVLYTDGAWGDVTGNVNYVDISSLIGSTTPSNNRVLDYIMNNIYTPEEEPINYGFIKDLSYSTNIVGSGTTTGDANVDTISWYPYWDTNDNISTTWNMQIQVVPGTWQGGTNTDIFSQSFQDFIINESGATDIYRGTYLNGSISVSWGEVKNKLSILSWADLFQYFDGQYWNKKGWVYRARYNDPDNDYWSDWQVIYSVTSSAGEGVEKYIDPSDGTGLPGFYQDVENSFNTTSVVNNNYNVVYYYVYTPIETNPSDDDSNEYLKDIRNNVRQIRRMLAVDNNADATPDNDNGPWQGNPAADLYLFEDSSINDFNDAVSDLPTSNLINGNKFLAASTWVRTQYETLVSNTPFEAVIIFSLLLGFGLLLIGKLR